MRDLLENAETVGSLGFIERKTISETPNQTSTIIVGEGSGQRSREFELIWIPGLFKSRNAGKLRMRFFIKKVGI